MAPLAQALPPTGMSFAYLGGRMLILDVLLPKAMGFMCVCASVRLAMEPFMLVLMRSIMFGGFAVGLTTRHCGAATIFFVAPGFHALRRGDCPAAGGAVAGGL